MDVLNDDRAQYSVYINLSCVEKETMKCALKSLCQSFIGATSVGTKAPQRPNINQNASIRKTPVHKRLGAKIYGRQTTLERISAKTSAPKQCRNKEKLRINSNILKQASEVSMTGELDGRKSLS